MRPPSRVVSAGLSSAVLVRCCLRFVRLPVRRSVGGVPSFVVVPVPAPGGARRRAVGGRLPSASAPRAGRGRPSASGARGPGPASVVLGRRCGGPRLRARRGGAGSRVARPLLASRRAPRPLGGCRRRRAVASAPPPPPVPCPPRRRLCPRPPRAPPPRGARARLTPRRRHAFRFPTTTSASIRRCDGSWSSTRPPTASR